MLPLSPVIRGGQRKTALLLHFDGTNGSTTYVDSSAYARSPASQTNFNLSTAGPKIGTANLANTNTTNTLLYANLGSFLDFTMEFWFKQTIGSVGNGIGVASSDNGGATPGSINFGLNNGASWLVTFGYYDGGGVSRSLTGTSYGGADTSWHHWAMARSGSTIASYFDGSQLGTAVLAPSTPISFSNVQVGSGLSAHATWTSGTFNIDELRISRVARYTSGFTPSTSAFTVD